MINHICLTASKSVGDRLGVQLGPVSVRTDRRHC